VWCETDQSPRRGQTFVERIRLMQDSQDQILAVKARLWLWLSGQSPWSLLSGSLFARMRLGSKGEWSLVSLFCSLCRSLCCSPPTHTHACPILVKVLRNFAGFVPGEGVSPNGYFENMSAFDHLEGGAAERQTECVLRISPALSLPPSLSNFDTNPSTLI